MDKGESFSGDSEGDTKDLNDKNNNSEESTSDAFFKDTNHSNIYQDRSNDKAIEINKIIDTIRRKSPISAWDLGKELKISHSKLFYIIRDLEFAGVIYSKVQLNKNNRSIRLINIGADNHE